MVLDPGAEPKLPIRREKNIPGQDGTKGGLPGAVLGDAKAGKTRILVVRRLRISRQRQPEALLYARRPADLHPRQVGVDDRRWPDQVERRPRQLAIGVVSVLHRAAEPKAVFDDGSAQGNRVDPDIGLRDRLVEKESIALIG